jgi:hypothetical protein
MPNLMQFLRMSNIFGQQPPIGNDLPSQGGITGMMPRDMSSTGPYDPNPAPMSMDPNASFQPSIGTGDANGFDPQALMAQMYHPQTDAEDRFNALQDKFPSRDKYKPSNLRRIGGALMAFSSGMAPGRGLNFYHANPGGIQAGLNFLDEPYNEAMADWKAQIQPAEYSANLERQGNTNERMLANQTVTQMQRDKKMEQDATIAQAKQDNANARTEVYRYKSLHPGLKFNYTGPTVTYADPITGKVMDTGVKTGRLSDQDKIDLNQEYGIERIRETGDQSRQTEETRQTGREAIAETRGWKMGVDQETGKSILYNEITGETKPVAAGKNVAPFPKAGSGSGFKPEAPTQTRVRQFNAARELYNTRPDLRPFIKLGNPGANDFNITPSNDSKWFGHTGPTAAQAKEIEDAIYGGASPVLASSHGSGTKPSIPMASGAVASAGPVAPAGRTIIYDKTGNAVGSVPNEQVEQAKQQGYIVR